MTLTENILHNVINGRVLTAITVQNELKDATIYMNVDPRIRQSAPKRDESLLLQQIDVFSDESMGHLRSTKKAADRTAK